jgi:tRNA pseudouridine55 synthase
VDGVILVDKPAGISSAEVVRRIKARVKPARVGHLGTLDPFATGLLPILVGEGTKLAPFLEESDKEYEGVIALGAETDTLDPTGETIRTAPVPVLDDESLHRLVERFTGWIEQVPPVFSAIKRGGVPLYKLARRGDEVEPPAPRRITIQRLDLTVASPASLRFTLRCSPGTYVRSLARDIGVALGSAGHLTKLRRTATSGFTINEARLLEEVLGALESGDSTEMIDLRGALAALPEVFVDQAIAGRIRNGDSGALLGLVPAGCRYFKVVCEGRLLAVCQATSLLAGAIARVFADR